MWRNFQLYIFVSLLGLISYFVVLVATCHLTEKNSNSVYEAIICERYDLYFGVLEPKCYVTIP